MKKKYVCCSKTFPAARTDSQLYPLLLQPLFSLVLLVGQFFVFIKNSNQYHIYNDQGWLSQYNDHLQGFDALQKRKIFPFATAARSAQGPIRLPILRCQGLCPH
jgi:hypothetical protein